ncbi:MAG: PorT family protein [Bacteroidaceae bacterium]|nr:PorT family protein [Bacteroidaceae bacterium]
MKRTFIAFLIAIAAISVSAQTKKEVSDTDKNLISAALKGWHIRLSAGYNIGGTAPLPLPREIRGIESYNPGLNLAIEGTVEKKFGKGNWGLRWGVRLDTKGMTTKAETKNYHMEAWDTEGSGQIIGAFTGKVKTSVKNTYVTVPVLAVYNINKRWNVSAGAYASYLLDGEFTGSAYDGYIRDQNPTGEKAEVTRAEYDFSNDMRKFNWGLQAGGEYKAYKHLAVFANLQWAMNGIFPSDYGSVTFELYPIYGTLGFTYLF